MESLLQKYDSLELNQLHRAVQNNELAVVQYLVKEGADISDTIDDGQTPLHLACSLNLLHISKELLKNKSRDESRQTINRQTLDTGTAALHLAARNNSLESALLLLGYGANFEIRDDENRRVKNQTDDKRIIQLIDGIEAVFESTLAIDSEILLKKLKFCSAENVEAAMYARNCQGFTALQCALENNNLEAVATIVNFRIERLKQNPWQPGSKFNELINISKTAKSRLSHLDVFCRKNNEASLVHVDFKKEVVNLLSTAHEFMEFYKAKKSPSLENQALLYIVEESLEFFGSWKSSVFVEKKTLELTLWKGPVFVARILKLCIGVPMQYFMKSVYTSEMLQAAKRNNWILVKKCLTGHPDMNAADADDWTALRYALQRKNYDMIKTLLEFGADPTCENPRIHQVEPLLLFAMRQMKRSPQLLDVMQILFQRVSDDKVFDFVNLKSSKNNTPLHYITDIRLVQFLMSKGAVFCATNNEGCIPQDYYSMYKVAPGFELLKDANSLFTLAGNNRPKELVHEMEKLSVLDLLAFGGTLDDRGRTLMEILELGGHVEQAEQIRELLSSEECECYRSNVADFFFYGTTAC